MGGVNPMSFGHPECVAQDGLHFHGSRRLKVNQHAALIWCHGAGAVNVLLYYLLWQGMAGSLGDETDLVHDFSGELQ